MSTKYGILQGKFEKTGGFRLKKIRYRKHIIIYERCVQNTEEENKNFLMSTKTEKYFI